MKVRKLRIAWSVAWGVVAVLLCVLWVRSYWRVDALETPYEYQLISLYGTFQVAPMDESIGANWKSWQLNSGSIEELFDVDLLSRERLALAFQFKRHLVLPWWFVILATVAVAATPWLRFRFSLRTMLIATTLVAAALSLIVWAVK